MMAINVRCPRRVSSTAGVFLVLLAGQLSYAQDPAVFQVKGLLPIYPPSLGYPRAGLRHLQDRSQYSPERISDFALLTVRSLSSDAMLDAP